MLKSFIFGLATLAIPLSVLADNAELNQETQIQYGQLIYLEGKLPNNNPLTGVRNGMELQGSPAACVNCHRESGLGSVEGNEIISPISGPALFGSKDSVIVEHLRRFNHSLSATHAPYDKTTFGNAVRSGESFSGKTLNPLMPRYQLADSEIDALMAYLRTLSVKKSSGVNDQEIHIATIVTPDVGEDKQKVFTQTIQEMTILHNVNVRSGLRQKISPIERRMQNRRKWRLDVWRLTGPSNTWNAQLISLQKDDPVFAIVSGLSYSTWQPVQDFCEATLVTCWFPSIEISPQKAELSAYSLYFNQGSILDANVLGHHLTNHLPGRVIQIDDGSIAAKAAKEALGHQMERLNIHSENFLWDSSRSKQINKMLISLRPNDALVLWLHPEALHALTTQLNAPTATIYFSALLAQNTTSNLNESWVNNCWAISQIEQAELRSANLKRFRDWMNYHKIPITDEKMQSEVYFAVNAFDWTVSSLLNNFYSHYLIERAESYLSMYESMQVQEEVQALMMGGESKRPPQSDNKAYDNNIGLEHVIDRELLFKRGSTSIYPRLSLGIGQRFASKGAYLTKLNKMSPSANPETQWIVP